MVPVEFPLGTMEFDRYLDGCKTVPILQNVMKCDTNKGDIMGSQNTTVAKEDHLNYLFLLPLLDR